MSGIMKFLGKKQIEQASQWVKSAGTFGAAAGVVGLYFTDWRVIVDYIPYYNAKFTQE